MPVDRDVLALARRQHGVVAAGQLAGAGLSRHAIAHRVASGWMTAQHRGVYLVGPVEAPLAAEMAAVLACGAGALLSHRAAAVLWGFCRAPAQALDVTVARRDVRSREGIRVHRVGHLHPHDATRRHGIPITSPARTLLDVATQATPRELERTANEARVSGLVTDRSLNEQFSRCPAHRGKRALTAMQATEPRLIRSEAEQRLLDLIRAARLPEPRANARLGSYEVDFLWPQHNLVVEVDGYAFHSSRGAFERDRRRDAELGAMGFRVIRITWRQIAEEPEATVATLAGALAVQRRPSDFARSSTVSA